MVKTLVTLEEVPAKLYHGTSEFVDKLGRRVNKCGKPFTVDRNGLNFTQHPNTIYCQPSFRHVLLDYASPVPSKIYDLRCVQPVIYEIIPILGDLESKDIEMHLHRASWHADYYEIHPSIPFTWLRGKYVFDATNVNLDDPDVLEDVRKSLFKDPSPRNRLLTYHRLKQ